jgi:hypothetical protein
MFMRRVYSTRLEIVKAHPAATHTAAEIHTWTLSSVQPGRPAGVPPLRIADWCARRRWRSKSSTASEDGAQKHHAETTTCIGDYFSILTITAGLLVRTVLCWELWLAALLRTVWC